MGERQRLRFNPVVALAGYPLVVVAARPPTFNGIMTGATWYERLIYAEASFALATIQAECFLKVPDGDRVKKSEIVPPDARTAIAWDWRRDPWLS